MCRLNHDGPQEDRHRADRGGAESAGTCNLHILSHSGIPQIGRGHACAGYIHETESGITKKSYGPSAPTCASFQLYARVETPQIVHIVSEPCSCARNYRSYVTVRWAWSFSIGNKSYLSTQVRGLLKHAYVYENCGVPCAWFARS